MDLLVNFGGLFVRDGDSISHYRTKYPIAINCKFMRFSLYSLILYNFSAGKYLIHRINIGGKDETVIDMVKPHKILESGDYYVALYRQKKILSLQNPGTDTDIELISEMKFKLLEEATIS